MENIKELHALIAQIEKQLKSSADWLTGDEDTTRIIGLLLSQLASSKAALVQSGHLLNREHNLAETEDAPSATNSSLVGSIVGTGQVSAQGDIIGGHKIVIYDREIVNQQAEKDALANYLERLLNESDALDLGAIDSHAVPSDPSPLLLSEVYVQPYVTERIAYGEDRLGNKYRLPLQDIAQTNIKVVGGWEMVPMLATEYINSNKKVVLQGKPGVGKSTFVNWIMYVLAKVALGHEIPATEVGLGALATDGLLPIRIHVGDFAESPYLGPASRDVWNYVQDQLGMMGDAAKPLLRALSTGKALIVFDDLDATSGNLRSKVIEAITDLSHTYPKSHYLVTCQTLPDTITSELKSSGFNITSLAPFSQEQIELFIARWYAAARTRYWTIPVGAEKNLSNSVRKPELTALARTPLLLTQMVLLHSSYGRSPEDRTGLYEEVTKLLLSRWKKDSPATQSLVEYLEIPSLRLSDLEPALLELAFATFEANGTAPVSKASVIEVIQKYLDGDWGKAQKLCEYIERTAGLLLEQNGKFTFPHPTFQEYLAAKYLSIQHDFGARAADLVLRDPDKWRSIYPLAVKVAGVDRGVMAINSLCYASPPKGEIDDPSPVRWKAAIVAGEAISEFYQSEINQRPERILVLKRVVEWLQVLVEAGKLTIHERNVAGKLLALLGDPRPGLATLEPDLVLIPKGPMLMNPSRISGYEGLKPYEIDIPYDYWISRYPVAQAQYALFITDNPEYRLPEGADGYSWDPVSRRPPRERSNQPVVLVSWHDAKAYCKWLSSKLRERGLLPAGYEVRLPVEPEWEKAAHGGLILPDGSRNPFPDRIYPWGNSVESEIANLPNFKPSFSETTPVGVFLQGVSPYGVLDMAGNAMEWLQTSWGSEDVDKPGFLPIYEIQDGRESDDAIGFRVLRGGSWLFAEGEAQCSCRLDSNVRYADVGMRIVVAPPLDQVNLRHQTGGAK